MGEPRFAFQRPEHLAAAPAGTGAPQLSGSTWLRVDSVKPEALAAAAPSRPSFLAKPDEPPKLPLQKQFDVVQFLISQGRKQSSYADILRATKVDLEGADTAVKDLLTRNPKVEILNDDDPSQPTRFLYFAKYNVSNRAELVRLVERCKNGINRAELHDTYPNAQHDINLLITSGEVIAQENRETKSVYLYPRGPLFLTKLRGKQTTVPGTSMVRCTEPVDDVMRRGEAVRLGDSWHRVSREVAGFGPNNQPARAALPLSVTADTDGDSRNVYALPFEDDAGKPVLPLHGGWPADAPAWSGRAVRHGCSQNVRALWRQTLEEVPKDEAALQTLMHGAGLTSELQIGQQRPTRFLGGRKREKKKRKRAPGTGRNVKITNVHLEGTDAGRLLEEARSNPDRFKGGGSGGLT